MQNRSVEAIRWQNDQLGLLDQRKLPLEEIWIEHASVDEVVNSIVEMVVRGAPAIGIAAAYGVALAGRAQYSRVGAQWKQALAPDLRALAGSRPTAVNLFWALDRMGGLISELADSVDPFERLLVEARAIHAEDLVANQTMGRLGADLIARESVTGKKVITHCNTGSLATGGYGTALGVIRSAYNAGLIDGVYADETRPWLQGSRLTAWELQQDGIPVVLNADGAAAHIMSKGAVSWVIVGADRVAANGDVANKIGTYSLAVLARYHGVKMMVVAPTSTFDLALQSGKDIPIEERSGEELTMFVGRKIAPEGVSGFNPVFDVTPAELIDVIVTERGVIESPSLATVKAIFCPKKSTLG